MTIKQHGGIFGRNPEYKDVTAESITAGQVNSDGAVIAVGAGVFGDDVDVTGDVTVSGGIYLGGTASANLLDDYEEGTWSPAYVAATNFTSVTYDSRTFGRYLKIGNMVYVVGRIVTDALSGGSGAVSLRLPFQPNQSYQHISIGYKFNFIGDYPAHIFTSASGFDAPIYFGTTFNGPTASTLQVTDMNTSTNANDIMFSGFYTTND